MIGKPRASVMAREKISLKKRDTLKLALYGQENALPGDWDALLAALWEVHKQMRRRLSLDEVQALEPLLEDLLKIHRALALEAEKMSGADADSERQHQNSNRGKLESEL